jgi:signal transduction histidine kinase/phage shock protein PspC (stress-responsive transcriptional regulator)
MAGAHTDTGPGGAGPAGGEPPRLVARTAADVLVRPPGRLHRRLPAPTAADSDPAYRPVVGGVCAAHAARRGLPARRVRRRFAATVLPALLYPVFWLVRAAGRPEAHGREAANRAPLLAVAAAGVGLLSLVQLADARVGGAWAVVAAVLVGAPLAVLPRSPLLTWRVMTVGALAVPLLPGGTDDGRVPFPLAAAAAYLLVLYVLAAQYERRVVLGVAAATALAQLIATTTPLYTAAPAAAVWPVLLSGAALLIGDNVRIRREGALAYRAPEPERRREPLPVLDGVADAVWRAPVRRPGGPFRLLRGPRRPIDGRVAAGVCAALSRGSHGALITLRVVFPLALPLGLAAYLLLWLVLPRADDPAADDDADPPPPGPREITAWAVLVALSGGATSLVAVQLVGYHGVPVAAAVLLGFATGLPLALLPVAPLLTWRFLAAGLLAVLLAVGGLGAPPEDLWPWPVVLLLALPVVLYAVATTAPGWTTVGVGAVTVTADIAAAAPVAGTPLGQVAWIAAVAAGVLLLGYNVRSRRTAQSRLARESALRRQDRARQAVLEERSRIARELHDVVSHHMSMIAIQAEAAPYKHPGIGPDAAATFSTIRDAARDALAEMRRVVGLLRADDEDAERAPQPGLALIGDLVAGARQAGMRVDVAAGVDAAGLPSAVDLSAYRIVQESLSNAGRHAPGAPVAVAVERTADRLRVRVANGPPPGDRRPAPDAGGHGLVGMRERVAMLGGRLSAGPLPDGGFAVTADLPLAAGRGGPAALEPPPSGGPGADAGPAGGEDLPPPGERG